jgi:hypothetical protein
VVEPLVANTLYIDLYDTEPIEKNLNDVERSWRGAVKRG